MMENVEVVCKKCGGTDFSPSGFKKKMCRACVSEKNKEYKKKLKAEQPELYRERNRKNHQRYRDSHREQFRAYMREYQRKFQAPKTVFSNLPAAALADLILISFRALPEEQRYQDVVWKALGIRYQKFYKIMDALEIQGLVSREKVGRRVRVSLSKVSARAA